MELPSLMSHLICSGWPGHACTARSWSFSLVNYSWPHRTCRTHSVCSFTDITDLEVSLKQIQCLSKVYVDVVIAIHVTRFGIKTTLLRTITVMSRKQYNLSLIFCGNVCIYVNKRFCRCSSENASTSLHFLWYMVNLFNITSCNFWVSTFTTHKRKMDIVKFHSLIHSLLPRSWIFIGPVIQVTFINLSCN